MDYEMRYLFVLINEIIFGNLFLYWLITLINKTIDVLTEERN